LMLRMQDAASETGREVTGEDLLSVSVGAAFFPEDGTHAEELMKCADLRMYANKEARKGGKRNTSSEDQTGPDLKQLSHAMERPGPTPPAHPPLPTPTASSSPAQAAASDQPAPPAAASKTTAITRPLRSPLGIVNAPPRQRPGS
jgi:hypothetical protein